MEEHALKNVNNCLNTKWIIEKNNILIKYRQSANSTKCQIDKWQIIKMPS